MVWPGLDQIRCGRLPGATWVLSTRYWVSARPNGNSGAMRGFLSVPLRLLTHHSTAQRLHLTYHNQRSIYGNSTTNSASVLASAAEAVTEAS